MTTIRPLTSIRSCLSQLRARGALVAATVALLAAAPACIVAERTHTLYLSPDGRLSWVALEKDVRSDAEKPDDRAKEEAEFLAKLSAGLHPVAAALDGLGATDRRTDVLRQERPFIAVTTARFESIDRMLTTLFQQAGMEAEVSLRSEGPRMRLLVRIDLSRVDLDAPSNDADSDDTWSALIEDASQYTIVLTAGRFVDGRGFTFGSGDTSAVPVDVDLEKAKEAGEIVYALSWVR